MTGKRLTARCFGTVPQAGISAYTAAELERAINEGFSTPGPTLIEYPLGEVPDPWHLIFQGKVRG